MRFLTQLIISALLCSVITIAQAGVSLAETPDESVYFAYAEESLGMRNVAPNLKDDQTVLNDIDLDDLSNYYGDIIKQKEDNSYRHSQLMSNTSD